MALVVVAFSLVLHKISWPISQDRAEELSSVPKQLAARLSLFEHLVGGGCVCPELKYLNYCSTNQSEPNSALAVEHNNACK